MAFNYGVFLANVNSRSRSLYAIARQSLSVVCLSPVVCLSVTLVRCTQPVEIFRNVSSPFDAWLPVDVHGKFDGDCRRGTPPAGR